MGHAFLTDLVKQSCLAKLATRRQSSSHLPLRRDLLPCCCNQPKFFAVPQGLSIFLSSGRPIVSVPVYPTQSSARSPVLRIYCVLMCCGRITISTCLRCEQFVLVVMASQESSTAVEPFQSTQNLLVQTTNNFLRCISLQKTIRTPTTTGLNRTTRPGYIKVPNRVADSENDFLARLRAALWHDCHTSIPRRP